jgi:hypothetical protein
MDATICSFSTFMADDAKALADGLGRRDPELLDRFIGQYQYRLFRCESRCKTPGYEFHALDTAGHFSSSRVRSNRVHYLLPSAPAIALRLSPVRRNCQRSI